ncbi:related to SWR1-complex protein 5 [Melanopsichium pennsylvanicum]|uniref:SWR1-complex protein 5 n=2 Tax=Melanopsichium pennsylvanicum TaxID=63383 RepID=A0AAJ5C4P7_9BASI
MTNPPYQTIRTKRDNQASNSGSDSEDDQDFIPEAEPSHSSASGSKTSIRPTSKAANIASDGDSDSENSDDDALQAADDGQNIDDDELEALKRERAELIAMAGGEHRLGKRRRFATNASSDSFEAIGGHVEAEAVKTKAAAEWEAIKRTFADSTATETHDTNLSEAVASKDTQNGISTSALRPEAQMVQVPTTYKFAGEIHTTNRLLPRSHPEAIKYLSQSSASDSPPTLSSTSVLTTCPVTTSVISTSLSSSSSSPPPLPPTSANRKHLPPGPRRKKTSSLAALSAAVSTSKPTKLNTLEKSKLDWDQYKADTNKLSQQELTELENQTKGGGKGLGDMKGYLERRDFLNRVQHRTGES